MRFFYVQETSMEEKAEEKTSFRNYLFRPIQDSEDYLSDIEDNTGRHYTPAKEVRKGSFAEFRVLTPRRNPCGAKKWIVAKPIGEDNKEMYIDFEEANNKCLFFNTLYPETPPTLFRAEHPKRKAFFDKKDPMGDSYRLILPFKPGIPYNEVLKPSPHGLRQLFLLATNAIQDCHQKGLIITDFKHDAILLHKEKKKKKRAYLVDGGLCAQKDQQISRNFMIKTEVERAKNAKDYFHIAPECWHYEEERNNNDPRLNAKPSMDVYSLGVLMELLCNHANLGSERMKGIIASCKDTDPDKRPTLPKLIMQLNTITLENQPDTIKNEELLNDLNKIC